MVRAVDQDVASATVFTEQLLGGPAKIRDIRSCIQAAWMVSLAMTLLAEERTPDPQHTFLGRTMGVVTD